MTICSLELAINSIDHRRKDRKSDEQGKEKKLNKGAIPTLPLNMSNVLKLTKFGATRQVYTKSEKKKNYPKI